jgi:hypothetical protein
MVVHEVDIEGFPGLEPEDHAPLGAYGDGPEASEVSCQGVKSKRWNVHRLNAISGLQDEQDLFQLPYMVRIHALGDILFEK